jgi:hypothetical protein
MKRSSQENERAQPSSVEAEAGWQAWNALPRDGPAVFVIDTDALSEEGRLHGRWLDPTVGAATFGLEVAKLIGHRPDADNWAIVDQVGLGEAMLPETFELPELDAVIAETGPGATP